MHWFHVYDLGVRACLRKLGTQHKDGLLGFVTWPPYTFLLKCACTCVDFIQTSFERVYYLLFFPRRRSDVNGPIRFIFALSTWRGFLRQSLHKYPDSLEDWCFTITTIDWAQSVYRLALGWTTRRVGVQFPVGSRIFPSPHRPNRLWDPPSLLSSGYRGLFTRG
jgi:hypothetical protein